MKTMSEIKLSVLFSMIVFIIQFISTSMIPIITITCIRRGYIKELNPVAMVISILFVISFLFGFILAKIIGNKVLKPICDLNEAIRKIAKGEFDVQIEEIGFGKEFKEMTHSFNIMTRELRNIETFRKDFVSNVSHEFKTPISAIEGYATLLQDETLSKKEWNNYVERIIASSKRLSKLSGNILMISKLENQQIVLDKKVYSLDEQIRNCVLLLENLWSEKNITLDIDMESVFFNGNKSMISHIWFNLISNAVKFTPNNGVISVTLKENDNFIMVSIADSGIGMSDETVKHIFEKFYCADKSRNDSGNGLGLPLTKRIVELCEGTIEVKSKKDLGSQFIITLPNDKK